MGGGRNGEKGRPTSARRNCGHGKEGQKKMLATKRKTQGTTHREGRSENTQKKAGIHSQHLAGRTNTPRPPFPPYT